MEGWRAPPLMRDPIVTIATAGFAIEDVAARLFPLALILRRIVCGWALRKPRLRMR